MSIIRLIHTYPITLIGSCCILVLCLIPLPNKEDVLQLFPFLAHLHWESKSGIQLTDKVVHATFYFIVSMCFLYETPTLLKRSYLWSFCYCFAWGGMIEILQSFLPYRSGNGYDLIANCIGAILGLAIYFLIYTSYERKNLSNGHHPPKGNQLRQHQKTD